MTWAGRRPRWTRTATSPHPDLTALLAINTASDWAEFRAALAQWVCPPRISCSPTTGATSARSRRVLPGGPQASPGPMPGTGADDVAGVIRLRRSRRPTTRPGTCWRRRTSARRAVLLRTTSGSQLTSSPGPPGRADLRRAVRAAPDDPGVLRGRADQPDRSAARRMLPAAGGAAAAPGAGRPHASGRPRPCWTGWHGAMTTGSAAASVWSTSGRLPERGLRLWWDTAAVPVRQGPRRAGHLAGPGQPERGAEPGPWMTGQRRFTALGGPRRTGPR